MSREPKQAVSRPPQHKRRTEEEMRGALADFVAGKARTHDDERDTILEDAITEVIQTRKLLMEVSMGISSLGTDIMHGAKIF